MTGEQGDHRLSVGVMNNNEVKSNQTTADQRVCVDSNSRSLNLIHETLVLLKRDIDWRFVFWCWFEICVLGVGLRFVSPETQNDI
jgi:hypothetical protein